MSKLITETQKQEIENLANNGHAETLIAYGANLHRSGIYKGTIYACVAFAIGSIIGGFWKKYKA